MDTKDLKTREPVWWFHVLGSVVLALGAIITNVAGNIPADANWLMIGGLVVRSGLAYATRTITWSPQTVESVLRRVGLSGDRARSIVDDASSLDPKSGDI